MSIDYELFDGKSLSSLFKDIYDNTEYNRKQLDVLTRELTKFIKDGGIETSIKDIQAESDNIHNKIEKDIKAN